MKPVAVDATFTLGDGAAPKLSTVLWSAGDVWVREQHDAEGIPHRHRLCKRLMAFAAFAPDPDRRYLYGRDAYAFSRHLGVAAESGMPGELQPLHGDADAVPTASATT